MSGDDTNAGLTFLLWKTFPGSMNRAEGARLREVLAEAVRRSRGFRKPAWTGGDTPEKRHESTEQLSSAARAREQKDLACRRCRSYLSTLSAHRQRLPERGALVALSSRGQVDL